MSLQNKVLCDKNTDCESRNRKLKRPNSVYCLIVFYLAVYVRVILYEANEPYDEKKCLRACAPRVESDQPVSLKISSL